MGKNVKKFAVFDIDGTVYRYALFFQIFDELVARKHLNASYRTQVDDLYEKYKRREHENAFRDYSQKTVDILFSNLAKIKVVDYKAAVDLVIERSKHYCYAYTRDLIAQLRREGYFLFALSGSEMYSVQEFVRHYGFDVAVGELYEEKNGYFTGKAEQVVHRKNYYIKKLVEEHKLSFTDSVAIGDSLSDKEMLEIVEHPIAFNPEKRLYDLAIHECWKIVVERKNVIYKLEKKDGSYILA